MIKLEEMRRGRGDKEIGKGVNEEGMEREENTVETKIRKNESECEE